MMCGATVNATITQISSQAPSINSQVPEGGKSALLLGSSLVGLSLFARSRRERSN
jgi:hypothetical protein